MLFGDYNSAIDDYTLAIKLKENYGIALYNRGIAKIMTNKQGYACDDFKASLNSGYEPANKALKDFCFQR
jgi:lipoprotein NlpI